jgi:ATP phosphoribosyltransferase
MEELRIFMSDRQVRLSLPSKGRLADDSLQFLADCGLSVHKPNPRQYEARIPAIPELTVLFQRPGDIVVSVRDGSVDFGITGMDMIEERRGLGDDILVLHDSLGFGHCALTLAVPESWENVTTMQELMQYNQQLGHRLRVATKFPHLTEKFLCSFDLSHDLISAEGTLETAPAIGYADLISDLVSSGQTLRDNRLRALTDGVIQPSEAALIANRKSLQESPQVLGLARQLLEYFEAYLRASDRLAIFANIRGASPEVIAERIFSQKTIGGLQGPTISRVYPASGELNWFAVHIVVRRDLMFEAVTELRAVGGSGVVVAPVTYIFEEEPPRYKAMLDALEKS